MSREIVRNRKETLHRNEPDVNLANVPACVGYARVSTFAQADAFQALKQQTDRLYSYGCPLVLRDVESGYTKGRTDRKWFNFIWEGIAAGKIKELVITRLDRLSRFGLTSQELYYHLKQYDCKLRSLDENFDFSNKVFYDIVCSLAEDYSNKLSLKIKRGYEYSRKQRRIHIPAFGYRIEDFTPVPDDTPRLCRLEDKKTYSEIDLARAVVDHFLSTPDGCGATCIWIKEFFGAELFYPSGLNKWLQGHQIYGDICFNTKDKSPELIQDNHEAIFSREQQQAIKDKLFLNNQRRGYGVTASRKNPMHPLSTLVYCGECGQKARFSSSEVNGIRYCYYKCRNPKLKGCSNSKGVRYEVIEDALLKHIENQAETIIAEINQLLNTPEDSPIESEEERMLQKRLETLYTLRDQGDSYLNAVIDDTEQQLKELQEANSPEWQSKEHDRQLAHLYELQEVLANFCLHHVHYDDEKKRRFYQRVVKSISVYQGDVSEISLWL